MTRSAPSLGTLILLTAFSTLSLNMFLPSLAHIAVDLNTSYSTISLAVSGYLTVTAIIQMVIGPLSDKVGRRPVLLFTIALFTLASVFCAIATDIWTFLTFRMIQGAIISGYALSQAIIRDTNPERETAGLIGYVSMAMAVAPMLGPLLGGMLDTAFGWRANFVFYAVSGLVLFILCWFDLSETAVPNKRTNADNLASLQHLAKYPLFWAYALCSAFSTGAFYIFLTGAPLVARSEFNVSTAQLGLFIGAITIGFFFGSLLAGRLAPRIQPTTMMLAGRSIAILGLITGLVFINLDQTNPLLFFGSTIFVGLGNGITLPSCNAAAMSVHPEYAGSAAGMNGALVVAGGAVLTSITGAILPAENPAPMLLMLMLGASVASLAAVVAALLFCQDTSDNSPFK